MDQSLSCGVTQGGILSQVVIGNLLDTRKRRVVLVTSDTEQPIIMSDEEMTNGAEIEEKIVTALVKTHEQFLSS